MLASRDAVRASARGSASVRSSVTLRNAALRAPRAFAPHKAQRRLQAVVVKAELKVGDKLDDFADYYRVLKSNDGSTVSLASFKGKKPVVLFFYPKAATPGCTKEACKFRDEFTRFTNAGAAVFGISSDAPEENDKFAKANRLPFPLLTDANSILRKTFGIKGDLMGLLPGRQTYVIDKDGKVIMSFNDQLNAEQHVDEALRALSLVSSRV